MRIGLPPSGRLSPGLEFQTIPEAWGLEDVQGLARAMLDFLSGIYTFSFFITFQWTQLVDAWQHLILPVIALGTISLAIIARITRSSLLEVLGLDYIRTARAKGVPDRSVLRKHAFRNAMLPVVTIIGLQLGLLAGRRRAHGDRLQPHRRGSHASTTPSWAATTSWCRP